MIRFLQSRKAAATIAVTAVTVLLIGGVLFTTTTLGCAPASKVGLKLAACTEQSKTSARLAGPTPTDYPAKGGQHPTPYPTPSYVPFTPPASNTPPWVNPASNAPPYGNPASGYPPQSVPGSGTDPFFPPVSGAPPSHPLNCRLPIYAGPPGSGGFIVLPQGGFVADPRSAVALPSPSPGSPSPAPAYNPGPGYGYGPGGNSYGMAWDALHSRWLPVRPDWVAPDGAHYAYPSTNSVYLVDAALNTQVELGAGHPWSVVKVLNDRVYATIPNTAGFWVLPFSGTPKQVNAQGYWQAATAASAYGMLTSAVPQGASTKIVKLDISTGTITDWFTHDGWNSSVVGFDLQGNPLVTAYYNGGQALGVTKSPNSFTVITSQSTPIGIQGPPTADGNGVWFPAYYNQPYGGQNGPGVVLYVAGSGIYWMASYGGQLAGGCA